MDPNTPVWMFVQTLIQELQRNQDRGSLSYADLIAALESASEKLREQAPDRDVPAGSSTHVRNQP